MFAKRSVLGGFLAAVLVLGTSGAVMADVVDPVDPPTAAVAAPEPAPEPDAAPPPSSSEPASPEPALQAQPAAPPEPERSAPQEQPAPPAPAPEQSAPQPVPAPAPAPAPGQAPVAPTAAAPADAAAPQQTAPTADAAKMRGVPGEGDCDDDRDKRSAGAHGDDCDGDGKDDDCDDDADKRAAGGGKDDDCDGDGDGDCEDDGDKRTGQHPKDDDDDVCDHDRTGTLKLVKVVINDDGGTATPADWDLQVEVDGTWTTLTQGTFHELPAGAYGIRETGGPAGYDAVGLVCTGGGQGGGGGHGGGGDDDKRSTSGHPSGDRVVIGAGVKVTCTFTNDDLPGAPVFDKAALGATAVDADTWSLRYRLSVTNPGPGAAEYTVTDTLGALPAGVSLVQAQAAADSGFPQTPAPLVASWDDAGPVVLALDEPIGQGVTHAFLVTVTVDVDVAVLPDPLPADCADIPGVGYPIPNFGSIEVDGIVVDDEACNVIRIVDLGIVKAHSELAGGAAEPGTPFTYLLDVTNHGTVDVIDGVVTDEVPADLDVLSVTVPAGWTDASTGNTVIVEDVTLAVGETRRISVEVVVPQPVAPVPPVLPPGADTEPFTPDFIGDLVNEACVTTPGDGIVLNDCDTDTVPVDQLIAELFVSCLNDIASLSYRVATSPGLAGLPISFTWAPTAQVPSPQPASVQRTLGSGDSGTILWPGGRLAPNDVSIQWPGYRPLTIGDYDVATGALLVDPALVYNGMVLDTTHPTYPWRGASTVTIAVNPTLVIQTSYPPATVNCEVPRSADLVIDKTASVHATTPGASFQYGLRVTNVAVDSVADPVVVTDIIPDDIRVDGIATSTTDFPRWRNCAVTGTDAAGFGGTLECTLLGPLAMGASAPVITLAVTVSDDTRARALTNTGEVCWGAGSDGLPFQACDDDAVTVTLTPGGAPAGGRALPATGGVMPTGAIALGVAGIVLGALGLLAASRRRTGDGRLE